MKQTTLNQPFSVTGVGLHSGAQVILRALPAAAGSGIRFVRTDVRGADNVIPARWDRVTDTRLCTLVSNEAGVSVGTVEHLMAALRGCNVDNAVIELDGPEVPVLDGSSAPFVRLIENAGLAFLDAPRRVIRVLKEISVEQDGKRATLRPSDAFVFSGEIAFDHPAIGSQRHEIYLVNGNFAHDLAEARTFGFAREVEQLRRLGLARGGSLDNAIVLDDVKVLNGEGLRFANEFIRHKLLDAIGDLYLAGAPILGAYDSYKSGHALNNALLHALFAAEDAWELAEQPVAAMPQPAMADA
jgi:UDP-3-O-[3-hydroxymyristoyl] N-acetylglucosamine deacetylase